MTEHYAFEKNRIRCPAKIRTNDYDLNKEHLSRDGSVRKVIRLNGSESLKALDGSIRLPPLQSSYAPLTNSVQFVSNNPSYKNTKIVDESEWLFNRNNFLSESWVKIDTSDVGSRISKQELTRRSDFGDFGDLDRNITFNNIRNCDSSFQQPTKLLTNSHNFTLNKDQNQFTCQTTFLQRTIQQKNNEINILLQNMNQQRKHLQSKIVSLQFQNINQKRSADRSIDSLTYSLKNLEIVSQQQEKQIQHLSQQLSSSNEQIHRISQILQNKQRQRFQVITNQIIEIHQLKNNNEILKSCIEDQKRQNNMLKDVIQTIQQSKINFLKQLQETRFAYQQQLLNNQTILLNSPSLLKTNIQIQTEQLSEFLQQQPKQQRIQNPQLQTNNKSQQNKSNTLQQQSCNQQQPLLTLEDQITNHQQLPSSKHKTSRKTIFINLLSKRIKELEQSLASDSTFITLQQTNQQIISMSLKQLNNKFQYNDQQID